MPDNQSPEKYRLLEMLGADVHKVPTVPYSNPNQYQKVAQRLAASLEGAIWSNQFDNTANRDAHARTTGPEIWSQTDGRVDAFVASCGTGGTFAGVSGYLKSRRSSIRCVLADPPGSSLYAWVKTGTLQATGSGSITEGIGIGRITANLAGAPIDDALFVDDGETVRCVYRLHLQEDEACFSAAPAASTWQQLGDCRVARELGPGHTVVTVLCDGGAKYQSRLFNREWLAHKGLAANAPTPPAGAPITRFRQPHRRHGKPRRASGRRHASRETVSAVSAPHRTQPLLFAAALILLITMGARQSLGLFVAPIHAASGLGIVSISFAMAIGPVRVGARSSRYSGQSPTAQVRGRF